MSPATQTVLAILVVLGAAAYLLRVLRRSSPGSGCGTSEVCACPAPKPRRSEPFRPS